ncbi:hypothetical protein V7166_16650 [Bacillus thuringiensis]
MIKEWYSIQDAADKLRISHTSISRYLHTYPDFFKVKRVGRKQMIYHEGLQLLPKIKDLYANGIQREEILEQLQGSAPRYYEEPAENVDEGTLAPKVFKNLENLLDQQQQLHSQNLALLEYGVPPHHYQANKIKYPLK